MALDFNITEKLKMNDSTASQHERYQNQKGGEKAMHAISDY